jgi:hypothetical protein
MKLFCEFRQDEEEKYRLDLYACALSDEEFWEVRNDLENLGYPVRYFNIQCDSIQAGIFGQYDQVIEQLKKLESLRWAWNEQQKEDKK